MGDLIGGSTLNIVVLYWWHCGCGVFSVDLVFRWCCCGVCVRGLRSVLKEVMLMTAVLDYEGIVKDTAKNTLINVTQCNVI